MTLHPIPHTSYHIGYIPKSSLPSDELMTYLRSYCQDHQIIFVKFEPHIFTDNTGKDVVLNVSSSLIPSLHPLFTRWNQVLDISQSEDDLLATMHHKTRYNIRLAAKKGVVVKEMSNTEGYAIFEKLYFDTCKRQKYHGHTPAYHQNIWAHIRQESSINDSVSLKSHILVSFYEKEPLGVFQLWHFKDTMYYVYGGSSITYKSVMAPNLLMWEAIRLAKSLNCKVFDMWGSLPPDHDPQDPWAGFTKFKSGYGTKFVRSVGSYDLAINKPAYQAYNTVQSIRSKLLKYL